MSDNQKNKAQKLPKYVTGQRMNFASTVREIFSYREMIKSFVRRDLRGNRLQRFVRAVRLPIHVKHSAVELALALNLRAP